MKKLGYWSLLVNIYGFVLLFFSTFRFILFILYPRSLEFLSEEPGNTLYAFLMGFRFDAVISSYILSLPFIVISVFELLKRNIEAVKMVLFYYVFVMFSVAYFIAVADIPYFLHFFQRISIGALNWASSPVFVVKMIFQEVNYLIFLGVWIVSVFIFYKILRKIFSQNYHYSSLNFPIKMFLFLLFSGLIFLSIRGRIARKSPIRIGTAYFCDNPFLNQLGLNPVFTLIKTSLEASKPENRRINLVDDDFAIKKVREYLGIKDTLECSPIARKRIFDTPRKLNVVLIIMESMSIAKTGLVPEGQKLTPFLDSLAKVSLYFSNAYTTGEHTFNGVFSTLFSFPAIFRKHPMKFIKRYDGIATVLRHNGYSTTFFSTHDTQFDNMEGFLRNNDFEQVIGQSHYPAKEVKTTLGVPDDYMFRFSIPIINKLAKKKKPFFVTFLTASDHGPYYVPEYFTPKSSEQQKKTVEYADWSLRVFFEKAKKQPWFDSTLFVLIGDHGSPLNISYEIPLNYHHSPLMFYSPKFIKPQKIDKIASQMDVFPTIMELLQIPFINNTLGVGLINNSRPYAIINGDDKIGVLNNELLLIFDTNKLNKLYKYKNKDRKNYINSFKEIAKDMEIFGKVNLQTGQIFMEKDFNCY